MKIPQKKICYIDFEYFNTSEEKVTPVCVAWQTVTPNGISHVDGLWLYQDVWSVNSFLDSVRKWREEGYIFSSYSWEAESRALIALGVDPLPFKAVDLYLEYRMLSNHNNEIQYGKQLINGKVVTTTPPPRWREERDEGDNYSKPEAGLGAAVYKMLGELIDTQQKKETRDLIIRGGPFSPTDRKRIMEYCKADIKYLHSLHQAMWSYLYTYLEDRYADTSPQMLTQQQYKRAEYAARTAKMVSLGYPVDVESLKILTGNIPHLLAALQRDINRRTEGALGFKPFVWDRKLHAFKRAEKQVKDWVAATYGKRWPLTTPTGQPSLSEEALKKVTSSRHDYKDDPVDQMLRFARFNQSINGFKPMREANKKSFWEYLGSDGRARPYMGIYGSQSSRSQPSATGFIFLKSAVFRGLVQPRPGKMIVGSDYGSQEFYIAALLSGDKRMRAAYESGDAYIAFAIDSKLAPPGATSKSHPEIRNRCKSTVLGISYDMTAIGLSFKITNDTGVTCTVDQAEEMINLFNEAYHVYYDWKQQYCRDYYQNGYCMLADGWYMLGDNQNFRSVGNVPIQGMGAVIMREAVARAQDDGLDVIKTLHDAVYIEADAGDWAAVDKLWTAMDGAFQSLCGKGTKVRQDVYAWGPDLDDVSEPSEEDKKKSLPDLRPETPAGLRISTQPLYIDGRAEKEYERWKEYMRPTELFI